MRKAEYVGALAWRSSVASAMPVHKFVQIWRQYGAFCCFLSCSRPLLKRINGLYECIHAFHAPRWFLAGILISVDVNSLASFGLLAAGLGTNMGSAIRGVIMTRYTCVCLMVVMMISACAPEVGSEKWCAGLKKKPEGEWTFNEAKDYAKHCLFK